MSVMAANKIFDKNTLDKDLIDFVIVVTQSADYRMPATACIVQDKLGLSRNIGAMDINLGCSGYVYGLAVAKALVNSDMAKRVLLIAVEKTSFFLHPEDVTLRTLQGDAATATIISRENVIASIDATDFGTDGSGYDDIIVPYGGSAELIERAKGEQYQYPDFVNMKGMEIFNFSVETVPVTVRDTLAKNKLNLEEIDFFLFHQANKIMIDTIATSMQIPPEKVPMNIATVGNTSSCSIPILLTDLLAERKPAAGARLLLCGFGVGLSWATTIMTCL